MGSILRAFLVVAAGVALATPGVALAGREEPDDGVVVEAPERQPRLGERLAFDGRWMGIPVGRGWLEVKELVEINGRPAYHIEAHGETNDVLSTFYPIRDTLHTYLDADTLRPLRFEKDQREGRYRAHEVVTFDHGTRLATYTSLLNGSVKEIPLPEEFHDLIGALYWFRAQPIAPNSQLTMSLYTDEKIYETQVVIKPPMLLELLKRGTFPCLVVEPKASFKGLLVKRGRIWAYMTADRHRIPLMVQATTPWGRMSAVIDETSLAAILGRKDDGS